MTARQPRSHSSRYVLCIRNPGYSASLELRKIYNRLPDAEAGKRGYTRVIDESGEDYLFPRGFFVDIRIPEKAKRTFARATRARNTG
jgi:hypothetical protein